MNSFLARVLFLGENEFSEAVMDGGTFMSYHSGLRQSSGWDCSAR